MTLSDIFDQLAYGELRQTFPDLASLVSGEGIPEERKKNLFLSIKLGLTELHKRFNLLEKRLTIARVNGRQTYVMDRRYAVSNTTGTEPDKYITDTAEPFKNDLMRIERILDADGCELTVNEIGNEDSAFITSFNTLVLPDAFKDTTFTVVYRADHPNIEWYIAEKAPQLVTVNLPSSHLEALLYYVASRIMNPVGMINEFHEGSSYAAKFEQSCARLVDHASVPAQMAVNTRLYDKGWA